MSFSSALISTDHALSALERNRNTPPDYVAGGDDDTKPDTFAKAPKGHDQARWERDCVRDYVELSPDRLENYSYALISTRVQAEIHAALIAGDFTEAGRLLWVAACREMEEGINKMLRDGPA